MLLTAKPPDRVQARRLPWLGWGECLIVLTYLLVAIGLTWRLWADPAHMAPTAAGGNVNLDIYLSTWFMRYVATALAHGHLPALVTTAINAPQGVNAMWNTSLLAPAVLLTPVTLLAGPVVSLTVLLTLGFAGSATSMFVVLRRWQASIAAAAIGGALFAFMPALVVAAQDHYHLQFAVLAPLIVDAVLSLVTGRGRPIRTGIWLGALVSIQLFCAEELLVDTAIAAAVIVLILLLNRPRMLVGRVRPTLAGVGAALGVVTLLCGWALWVQFHGPLAEHGSPWNVLRYGYPASSFVTAPGSVFLHGYYPEYLFLAGLHPIEVFNYLGWPLLVALILIPFVFWRDLRIRVAGLSFLLLEWMTMGGHSQKLIGRTTITAKLMPWHWLQSLPVLDQVIVNRLSILSDGVAAVVLALVADRVFAAIRRRHGWRRRALIAAGVASLAAIVVPIIPRPVPASQVSGPPPGWTTVISRLHLRAGDPVLVLPLNGSGGMEWQAITSEPISINGGYCIAPDPTGKATKCATPPMLTSQQLTVSTRTNWLAYIPGEHPPSAATMATALKSWHPAAVVITLGTHLRLTHFMYSFFGPPTAMQDGVMGWRTNASWYQHLPAYLQTLHGH